MTRRTLLTACLLLIMSVGIANAHPLMGEARVWDKLILGSPLTATDEWEFSVQDKTFDITLSPEDRYSFTWLLTPTRAAGHEGLYLNVTQTTNAGTGGLHAAYFTAQAGTVGGTGQAKLMALEAKTRQPDAAYPYHSTIYFSTDVKDQTSTEVRGIEGSMDGDPGGSSTTMYGVKINNNTSGTWGTSYGFAIQGPAAWDYDFLFQNGITLDENTDGMLDLDNGYLDIQQTLTSQTTENNSLVIVTNTDSTYLAGSNITYSGGSGSAGIDVSGTYSGVNGGYVGVISLITSTGAHTADGAGTMAVKGVTTNTAQLADGNIYGGMFWAKHNAATNDMLASAALIGLEGMAYPSNVGHVQTLIGVNAGYHIEATTENHEAGSVARGIQVVCDDASSNTDPVEETGICIWNMTGDQDHVFNVTHSASGFTNFVYAPTVSGCFSSDTGTVPSESTHKIKVLMGSTTGYIPVHADW